MSSWEDRMAAKQHPRRERERAEKTRETEAARRAYLGEVFLRFYPQEPYMADEVEILPEVIAANCLGITYGDPGPKFPPGVCRQCWGERQVWLGNCWGGQHTGAGMGGCGHECHAGEVWMASPGVAAEGGGLIS